jgi:hypothetical protein
MEKTKEEVPVVKEPKKIKMMLRECKIYTYVVKG